MDKKVHLFFKTFTLFTLLLLLLILPVHALEKGKVEKITSFEELEKAIVQTQEKIKENPEEVEEYCRLAQLMLKKGQYDAAKQSLQNVLNIKPNHIDSLLTLSRVYWGLYQFEKGEETFKKVKALDPENRKAQFLEATFAIDRMDFDAALSIYQSILEKKPESAEALCGIAEVFYWRDQFEKSEKYIKKCLSLNPEISRAYLIQSLIHRLRQENDEWKETGLKAVELAPFDELARTNLAKIFMRGESKMDEGYEQIQTALKINPYSYNSHLFLGTGWTPKNYKEQKIEGDEETVNKIIELIKEGDGFLLNQEFDKADIAFSEALKLAPSNITAQIGKGTMNYHRKEYRIALSWFFKVLDIESDYGLAHYGVCQSLLRLKDRINVRFSEIEKEFAAKDEAEPPYLREVFINYEQLDAELQKIIRFSVKPLNNYLKVLKDGGATFYLIPFHKLLWECPYLA
ncbi:tetratricopeptide repeat protein, partial [bacterium]|nr:tetratricopeptide repeat protein [bacterium]